MRAAQRPSDSDGWQPDADLYAALGDAVGDDVWWVLMLSEAAGRPSLRELSTWTARQIAVALVLDEAVSERVRYARLRAEHDAAARRRP